MSEFKEKYLKYKNKYLIQKGGNYLKKDILDFLKFISDNKILENHATIEQIVADNINDVNNLSVETLYDLSHVRNYIKLYMQDNKIILDYLKFWIEKNKLEHNVVSSPGAYKSSIPKQKPTEWGEYKSSVPKSSDSKPAEIGVFINHYSIINRNNGNNKCWLNSLVPFLYLNKKNWQKSKSNNKKAYDNFYNEITLKNKWDLKYWNTLVGIMATQMTHNQSEVINFGKLKYNQNLLKMLFNNSYGDVGDIINFFMRLSGLNSIFDYHTSMPAYVENGLYNIKKGSNNSFIGYHDSKINTILVGNFCLNTTNVTSNIGHWTSYNRINNDTWFLFDALGSGPLPVFSTNEVIKKIRCSDGTFRPLYFIHKK